MGEGRSWAQCNHKSFPAVKISWLVGLSLSLPPPGRKANKAGGWYVVLVAGYEQVMLNE